MHRFSFLLIIILLIACDSQLDFDSNRSSEIVVEGWIEDGGFPVVILTTTLPVSKDNQEVNLSDHLLRWATVTVSDGTDSVILTGKYDAHYYPPFIYTTGRMRGIAGKRYTLDVTYDDYHATSATSIPSRPQACTFRIERCTDSDSLYQIKARLSDNPATKDYYQFFTRVGSSTLQYQAAYLGTLDDATLDTVSELPVYQGHKLGVRKYSPYYTVDDTVSVKLSHIDYTSFQVWDSYLKSLSLSGNMFLSTANNMHTNIQGGYGYWCGLNSITAHLIIRDSIQ